MEEEIKIGEQEREGLRIETQRLRDELSDLKVEAEILQDKLRKRNLSPIATDITAPNSPSSPTSTASSPMISTPPDTKSVSTDAISDTPTPPSPPMSESSATARPIAKTPSNPPKSKMRLPSGGSSITPKPSVPRYQASNLRTSRGPAGTTAPTSSSRTRNATPSVIRNTKSKAPPTRGLPNSQSLTHIRSLTAQMQRLEQRVQSARSKLPAPVNTPPRASPRNISAMGHNYMPPSVTIRSRKRNTGSTASGSSLGGDGADDTPSGKHVPRLSTSGISRLSFGPVENRLNKENSESSRPSSRAFGPIETRHIKENSESSRPSSRASATSFIRPDRPLSRAELARPVSRSEIARPASRTSMTGSRTPLGHYSQSQLADARRPRSSIGGNFGASHGHGHSQSVSNIDFDKEEMDFATPSRRGTFSKESEGSAIPLPRRKSGSLAPLPRRTSSGAALRDLKEEGGMKPPGRPRKLSHVGESY